MNIIKLNAIDSTSLFLKELSKKNSLENFTTVVADKQHQGKGQMDTQWHAAEGKNLLFTVYSNLKGLPLELQPVVSFLVAIKLRETLQEFLGTATKLEIKWPNDIMSYHYKIAGILLESTLKQQQLMAVFVGIGLNVNQLNFPEFLTHATSMSLLTGLEYDRNEILTVFLEKLKEVLHTDYILENCDKIKEEYLSYLYKYKTPCMFKDKKGAVFMGKIVGVSSLGLLEVEKEDELLYSYAVKEIGFL